MKVLVTGATGLLGSNIVEIAHARYGAEVIATVRNTIPTKPMPCNFEKADITDGDRIYEIITKYRPDVVIHCAALVDALFLELNHEAGWRIYVSGTENVAHACQESGAIMVYISTDWVFDGENPPYTEDSAPCPVNYYGILKVAAETLVRSIGVNYAIVRVAGVYGINKAVKTVIPRERPVGFGSLVNWILARLLSDKEVLEYGKDEEVNLTLASNPTLASDAADSILRICERRLRGTFHVCCRDCIDRLSLARQVAKVFGLKEHLVKAISANSAGKQDLMGGKLRLPKWTCLNTAHSEKVLGKTYLGVSEALARFKEEVDWMRGVGLTFDILDMTRN